MPSETTLGKPEFSFASGEKNSDSFLVRSGSLYLICPLRFWDAICLEPAQTFGKVSVDSYVHLSCWSWNHCFLGVNHHPWLLQSFNLLFHKDAWAFKIRVWWRISHLGLVFQSVSFCAHCPHLVLHVRSHQTAKEDYLIRADWDFNLWA